MDPDVYIFVASPVPDNVDLSKPWPEYEAVNTMAEQIGSADANGRIIFVDMNRIQTSQMKTVDYTDGFHFSESGARKVVLVWFDALQESNLLISSP